MKIKPLVIANWKLGLDHTQAIILASQVANSQDEFEKFVDLILCPSVISLDAVRQALGSKSFVGLGVQNIYSKPQGSFTGETSILSVKQLGGKFVIIGHSERRKYFAETNEDVAKKTALTLTEGLTPIVCVGETYEERQQQQAEVVVTEQLVQAFEHVTLKASQQIIVAYEPIWAIGTGQAIEPKQAHLMGLVIHQQMLDVFPKEVLQNIRVIYGGSVDGSNVLDFVDGSVLSGVLVGGASQQFESLRALVQAYAKQ